MADKITKTLRDVLTGTSRFDLLSAQRTNPFAEVNRGSFNNLVKTHVPVLRCHMRYKHLTKDDFSTINSDCAPYKVINGRYASNLAHTSDYFLFFHNVEQLQEYFKYTQTPSFNGMKLNCKEVNDFVNYMRFMYPNYLPDLDDLGDLLTIARKSAVIKDKLKAKELRLSLKLLLEKRTEAYERYNMPNKERLEESSKILSKFITKKYGSFSLQFPQVPRSNCVVLKNFPSAINHEKLLDFLWDLKWHNHDELHVRETFVHKETNFATLVLCFDSPQDAAICIHRLNNQHLFYNSKLPVVSAEPL